MIRTEIRKAMHDIHDGLLERRLGKARSWLERAEAALPRLGEQIVGVAQDYRLNREMWTGRRVPANETPRVDLDARAQARRMLVGALAAGLLEILFAAFISAHYLNANRGVAVAVGVVVAVLLALMIEGARVKVYKAHRPLASLRSAERWVAIAFWVALAGLLPLVAARTVPGASRFTGLALGILTLALPTLVGSLFVTSFVLRWSERLSREYDRLLAERQETMQLIRELQAFLATHKGDDSGRAGLLAEISPAPQPIEGNLSAKRAATFVGILALAALRSTGIASAGSPPIPDPSPSTYSRLLIAVDVSGSLDPVEFARIQGRLAENLMEITEAFGVSRVDLLPWATGPDCWRSPYVSVELPAPSAVASEGPLTEAEELFSQALHEREERERCEREAAKREARGTAAAALAPLSDELLGLRQGKAPYTTVREALQRCRAEPASTLVVLVTDGVEECGPGGETATRALRPGATTVVVLVPSVEDRAGVGKALEQRRQWIEAQAPWAKCVFAFQVSGHPRDWLVPLLEEDRSGVMAHASPDAR